MPWDRSSVDPSRDWVIFDGKEDVTFSYYDETTDAYSEDTLEFDALIRDIGYTLVTLNTGETTGVDTVIHCQACNFADGRAPRRLDRIARYDSDDDETPAYYTIQNLRLQSFGTRYRFECNRQYPST